MRKLAIAGGAVALTVALGCAGPANHLTVLVAARGSSVDHAGASVDSTPGRDRTPAQCLPVRLRSGGYALRLQDLESGVRGVLGTPVVDLVLTPSSTSVPRPVAHTDVEVSRPWPWSGGTAIVRHINGAGIEGSCLVLSAPNGTLTSRTWP